MPYPTNMQTRNRKLTMLLLLFVTAILPACMFGTYTPRPVFTVGDSMPCPSRNDAFDCILEFPEFGYFAVNGQGWDWEGLGINVFLAPHKDVAVRWLGSATLVDLVQNKVIKEQVLVPQSVVGGVQWRGSDLNDERLIGIGRRITASFSLNTSSKHMELRFPSVYVGDKEITIPSIQIRQKLRLPVVAPLMKF